jgi:hypothetical protein
MMIKAQNTQAIQAFISGNGIKVLDYRGIPTDYTAWEQKEAARRSGNRGSSLAKTGRGPNPKRDRAIALAEALVTFPGEGK